MLTKEAIQEVVGKNRMNTITDELIESVNESIKGNEEAVRFIYDNFITYRSVMQDGRFTIEQYVNAIKFCSYKMMDMTNLEAYAHTYPDRFATYETKYMVIGGMDETEFRSRMGSYVSAVAKSKLVVGILNQIQIPTKLINMNLLQEAINVEADLMYSAKSEMVREKAANTLINYLGEETENSIQIDIGVKKDEIIDKYEAAMLTMVEKQLEYIEKGGDVKAIANAEIITVDVEEESE